MHSTYKTKTDFLRWWREKVALQKKVEEEQRMQANRAISLALLVWADDGGAADWFPLLGKQMNRLHDKVEIIMSKGKDIKKKGKNKPTKTVKEKKQAKREKKEKKDNPDIFSS